MTVQRWLSLVSTGLSLLALVSAASANPTPLSQNPSPETSPDATASPCPPPALSRLKRHTIAPGETVQSIAQQYNLIPATLMGFNPVLRGGQAPVGRAIVIPPYNGIQVRVPAGWTWQKLATVYNVRADALFEVNGCQPTPPVAFVPGVNWSPGRPANPTVALLQGYPLPAAAQELMGYGWQLHPVRGQVFFHSGVDLLAKVGTPVLSVGAGIVAYTGLQGNYGNLVVVNHPAGKQTRYAQLDRIVVKIGQRVQQGDVLGTVGTTGQPDLPDPHLHFEVRYQSNLGWVAEDPERYVKGSIKR